MKAASTNEKKASQPVARVNSERRRVLQPVAILPSNSHGQNSATPDVASASPAIAALASHTAPAWEAYPNPAADVLSVAIDLPTAGPVRVELFDLLGRAVRRQTLAAAAGPLRQQLDLGGLAPGLYVLRLTPPSGPALSRQVVRE